MLISVEVYAKPLDGKTVLVNGVATNVLTDGNPDTFINSENARISVNGINANVSSIRLLYSSPNGAYPGQLTVRYTDGTSAVATFYNTAGAKREFIYNTNPLKAVSSFDFAATGGYVARLYELTVIGALPVPVLAAEPAVKSVKLSWSDLDANDFLRYDVYQDGSLIGFTTTRAYLVNGLTPDQEHDYHVVAVYITGTTKSNTVSLFAYDSDLPKPVLSGTEWEDRIELAWRAVNGAQKYLLYANGSVLATLQPDRVDYVHSGLAVGQDVTYRLVAVDKYNREFSSDLLSLRTREPPPPEYLALQIKNVTYQSFQVSWNNLAQNYDVYLNGDLITSTINQSYAFSRLDPDTDYLVKVAYTDKYGRLLVSDIQGRTEQIPQPESPRLTAQSIKKDSLRLSWSAGSFVTRYDVYQDGVLLSSETGRFKSVNGLNPSTGYTFYVVAIDPLGREVESNVLSVTTPAETDTGLPPGYEPPTPSDPTKPPPEVSHSGNEDLDKVNDHLVEGSNQAKANAIWIIYAIIGIIVLIFGVAWLLKVWKRKMQKALPNARTSGKAASAPRTYVPRKNYTSGKSGSNKSYQGKYSKSKSSDKTEYWGNGKPKNSKKSYKSNNGRKNNYHVEKTPRNQGNYRGSRKRR